MHERQKKLWKRELQKIGINYKDVDSVTYFDILDMVINVVNKNYNRNRRNGRKINKQERNNLFHELKLHTKNYIYIDYSGYNPKSIIQATHKPLDGFDIISLLDIYKKILKDYRIKSLDENLQKEMLNIFYKDITLKDF